MQIGIKEYIKRAKEQLWCNASEEDKKSLYLYDYTDEQVDEYFDYFQKCYDTGLSAYKALLFFHDWLNESDKNRKEWFKNV